jgi:two-component system, chemotaxis family, response regulator WspR
MLSFVSRHRESCAFRNHATLSIPPRAPQALSGDAGARSSARMSKRVLIVDDDPDLLEGLRNRLHGRFDVDTAQSAEAAIARLACDPSIAVVVADFHMPGTDGITLLSKLRQERPDVVRILLSGNADVTVARDAINVCGVFKLVLKPSPAGEIESTITSALDRYEVEMKTQSLALEDYLLGIGNRRALDRALARLHSLTRRHGRQYSLAMMDVDRFKDYNDTYGHLAGDRALQAIAKAIRESCRGSDEAFRYGGEEILLLLPETPAEGAQVACERIRTQVEALAIPHLIDNREYLTISVGGASYDGNERVEPRDLLERADRALYRSKATGRNRVTFWSPDM